MDPRANKRKAGIAKNSHYFEPLHRASDSFILVFLQVLGAKRLESARLVHNTTHMPRSEAFVRMIKYMMSMLNGTKRFPTESTSSTTPTYLSPVLSLLSSF